MTPRKATDMRSPTRSATVSQIAQRSVARSTQGYQSQDERNSATSYGEDLVRHRAASGVQSSGRAVKTIIRKATRPLKPIMRRAGVYTDQQLRKAMPRTAEAIRTDQRKKSEVVERFKKVMPKTSAVMRTTGRAVSTAARVAKHTAKPLAKGLYQTGATAYAYSGTTDSGFQSGAAATEAAMRTGASIAAKPMQKLAKRGVKAAFKPAQKLAVRGLKAAGQAVMRMMMKVFAAAGKALLSLLMSLGWPAIVIILFFLPNS